MGLRVVFHTHSAGRGLEPAALGQLIIDTFCGGRLPDAQSSVAPGLPAMQRIVAGLLEQARVTSLTLRVHGDDAVEIRATCQPYRSVRPNTPRRCATLRVSGAYPGEKDSHQDSPRRGERARPVVSVMAPPGADDRGPRDRPRRGARTIASRLGPPGGSPPG